MSLHQFWLVLRARWLVAFGIFSCVVIAALAFSLFSPKQYTSSASVVIDVKADPVAGIANPALMMTSYIATQVDIISSERVARRVVKALKLDAMPYYQEKWRKSAYGRGDLIAWIAETQLMKRLVVTPSRESDVIDISLTWPDAEFAATLANAFAQAYIDTNIEMKVEPAKQYAAWFDERSRALRTDLESKQKRLSDYESETGIIAADEHLDIELARLNELSTQLVAIQGQRQDSQSRQQQVNGENASLPEVLQSPLIGKLKTDLSSAEAKRQDIATSLGQNHPDYQTISAQVSSLRQRISEETAKIAASLGSATKIDIHRENDVRIALEAQKRRVLELKHQHDASSVLQNDVLTAQRNLDAVTQRLAQSNLESQAQQTNILLLTPAVAPVRHSSPNIRMNLTLALFLGSVMGLAVVLFIEMADQRVRDDKVLAQLLGVPILGRIGHKPSGGARRQTSTGLLEPPMPTTS